MKFREIGKYRSIRKMTLILIKNIVESAAQIDITREIQWIILNFEKIDWQWFFPWLFSSNISNIIFVIKKFNAKQVTAQNWKRKWLASHIRCNNVILAAQIIEFIIFHECHCKDVVSLVFCGVPYQMIALNFNDKSIMS